MMMTRRAFVASSALAYSQINGANDRIRIGIIGCGGQAGGHLRELLAVKEQDNIEIAAVCDVFTKRAEKFKETAGGGPKTYKDYRSLLADKSVDYVLIATPEHWHFQMILDAASAGKHIYCEKPMTRYLGEAFRVHDVVKKTGKIFQVGSQGCSAGGWHKAAELIKGGKIGQLVWSQGYYCRNNPKGEWNYAIEPESTPANIDWETWEGQVNARSPFSADRFHRWRKYYPYCGGLLGDLVPHRLHPLMLASGNPEFPSRVISIGSKNVHTDKNTPGTPERDVPEHVQLTAEFPSGYMLTVTCSTVNAKSPGFVIYGHKATLNMADQGQRLELLPERDFTEDIDPLTITGLQPEDIRVHEKNWFDCIRSGKQPNAGIDLAIKVQTVISLAEMAERLKIVCLFDEKTRKITDGAGKEIPAITYGTLPLS